MYKLFLVLLLLLLFFFLYRNGWVVRCWKSSWDVKDVQLLYFYIVQKKIYNCKLYIYIRSHSKTHRSKLICTSITSERRKKKLSGEKGHTDTRTIRPTPKNCCFLIIIVFFYSLYNICKMNMYTKHTNFLIN